MRAIFRRNRGGVERFEKEFAKAFQAVDAVAFPYGRSAQWAFFKAIGIENAEVIMPAYTCSVVAHAVTLSGNIPRFIDITLDDYNMNLDEAEAAINRRTRAIIATHTFGYPQDLDRLEAMVRRAENHYGHKVWLMQDCCHAFGAKWKSRLIGTSGDVAVYAFNISKIITSIFGGILTFQNKILANKVRHWRDTTFKKPGLKKNIYRRMYLIGVYAAFLKPIYKWVWYLEKKSSLLNRWTKAFHLDQKVCFPPDYLKNLTNFEAEVGRRQLKKYSTIIKRRKIQAKIYDKKLKKHKMWKLPPILTGATYSHYTISVLNRKQTIQEYAKKGIHLGEVIQYSIPALKPYSDSRGHFPNAEKASKSVINFPI